jgi:hypothetical protein
MRPSRAFDFSETAAAARSLNASAAKTFKEYQDDQKNVTRYPNHDYRKQQDDDRGIFADNYDVSNGAVVNPITDRKPSMDPERSLCTICKQPVAQRLQELLRRTSQVFDDL